MTSSKKLIQASAGVGGSEPFYDYEIDYSARFNDNDSAYLYRTPSSATNSTKWTYSVWVKRANLSSGAHVFLSAYAPPYYFTYCAFENNSIIFGNYNLISPGWIDIVQSTDVMRDSSAWYHFVWVYDSANATTSNRVKLYVNNKLITSFLAANYPTSSYAGWINNTVQHSVGSLDFNGARGGYVDGYMSQGAFVDGQALDPTSFGEEKNGVWVPKDVSGLTFGTNGFYLDFSNSAALGTDVSGNGNNFTSSGLTSSDQVTDTPTNSFATFSPVDVDQRYNTVLLSEGNTQYDSKNSTFVNCTMLPRTGKWYWELMSPNLYTNGSTGYRGQVGIVAASASEYDTAKGIRILMGNGYGAIYNGRVSKYTTATYKAGATNTVVSNDILGMVYDADNLTFEYLINNVSWSVVTGLDDKQHLPFVQGDGTPSTSQNTEWNMNFGNNGDFNGNKTAQGNADENGYGDFYYTPPTGALALCTANLPEPTIGPNSDTLSDENFNTVLYTGNGTTQSITGVGFQPDFTWIKNRDATNNHWWTDVLRGTNFISSTSTNTIDKSTTNSVTSFDSDGFSVGNNVAFNGSGSGFVAWNWKLGGSGVSNTNGSLNSTVSVNSDAGMCVGSYIGNGYQGATVGHGLGVAPAFVHAWRDAGTVTGEKLVYHAALPSASYYLNLSTTSAQASNNIIWGGTSPTSSVFSIGNYANINGSGSTHYFYAFAEVEGFSSFGSYTGNGSTNGPFIYTGFRPAFVITKRTDTSGYGWVVMDAGRDQYNVADAWLYTDSSSAEVSNSSTRMDFLSNGFKFRGESSTQNASGGTWIYMAFAENPFKYANAR